MLPRPIKAEEKVKRSLFKKNPTAQLANRIDILGAARLVLQKDESVKPTKRERHFSAALLTLLRARLHLHTLLKRHDSLIYRKKE